MVDLFKEFFNSIPENQHPLPPVGRNMRQPEIDFDAIASSLPDPVHLTKSGDTIFQTDSSGNKVLTYEGWKEHQEAAVAWMDLAGHAANHLWEGFGQSNRGGLAGGWPVEKLMGGAEASLKAIDGLTDLAKGIGRGIAWSWRNDPEEARASYNAYLELTAKFNDNYGVWKKDGVTVPYGTEGAVLDSPPSSYLGNFARSIGTERHDKAGEGLDRHLNPQWADSWSLLLDPTWLLVGGQAAKVSRLMKMGTTGEKLAKAAKQVSQFAGRSQVVSQAAKWTSNLASKPVTGSANISGRVVSGAGKVAEFVGEYASKGKVLKTIAGVSAGVGLYQYSDRDTTDMIAAAVAGWGGAKMLPKAIIRAGAATRGVGEVIQATAKVGEKGTFGRAIQSGMYSAGTNKALKLADNVVLNSLAHNSGKLANIMVKGSAFGAGMGYLIAGKEGAASGLGIGVIGGPVGALQGKFIVGASKFPFFRRNKEGKWEKTYSDSIFGVPPDDLITNFLANLKESDREALLSANGMSQDKLYSMALLQAYAMGMMQKSGEGTAGDLVVRYMDDAEIKAMYPDNFREDGTHEFAGTEGVYHPSVDGKPTVIINRDHSVDPLRTFAHEIFHPEWEGTNKDDPLIGLRAEMESSLFGVRDEAGNVMAEGLYSDRQFLSLENQYLSKLHKGKPGEIDNHITTRNMQERRTFIAGEMLSESFGNFAEAAKGDVVTHARSILRGAKIDDVTAAITGGKVTGFDLSVLGRMRQALEWMGLEFDSAGDPKSTLFRDPTKGTIRIKRQNGEWVALYKGGEGITNSKAMDKLIAEYVVAKDKVLERLNIGEREGGETVVTAKQILEKGDPSLVQKLSSTGMFKLDNNGNVIFENGAPVLMSRKERVITEETLGNGMFKQLDAIAQVEHVSGGMVRKVNDKGDVSYSGRYMNKEQLDAVLSLPDEVMPKSMKAKLAQLNEMMTKGYDEAGNLTGDPSPNFLIQYYKATTGSKYTSKAKMSHQLAAPFGWSISQAGNFNLMTLSVGRFEGKINKWWKKAESSGGGRYRAFTDLFDGSKDQFRGDVIEYLNNQAVGRENPAGAKKQAIFDFLNVASKAEKDAMPNRLSTDKEHVVPVSLRVDRMEHIQSSLGTPMPVNYGNLKINLMPAGKKPVTPKGDEGAQYMPGGNVARKIRKDIVILDDGFLTRFMPSPVEPNAVLKDFHKKKVQILTTDLSVAADKAVDGVIIKFTGGPGHLGLHDGWGFTNEGSGKAFGTRWKREGNPLIGITSMTPNNHLNQPLSREYYTAKWREGIENGLISERKVNKHVREVMDRIVKSEATGVGALPDKIKAQLAKVKTFKQFSKIFHDEKIIPWTHASKIYKKLAQKTLPISFDERVSLGVDLDSIAHATRQPEYHEAPAGSLLAIAEYDGTPATFRPDLNKAYPWFVPLKEKAFLKQFHDVRKLSTDKDLLTPKGKVNPGTMMGKGIMLDKLAKGDVQYMPAIGKQDALGMFSKAERAAVNIKQERGTASQMLAMLKKSGVKDAELSALGLDKFLEGNRKVTKDEIIDHLVENQITVEETVLGMSDEVRSALNKVDNLGFGENQYAIDTIRADKDWAKAYDVSELTPQQIKAVNEYARTGGETKHASYVEPGAVEGSYRELLLRLPEGKAQSVWLLDPAGNRIREVASGDEARAFVRENPDYSFEFSENQRPYTGGHYGEYPNVLAHVRFNDQQSKYGKTLNIQEVQSDLHQEGRKKGYKTDVDPAVLKKINDLKKAEDKLDSEIQAKSVADDVPQHLIDAGESADGLNSLMDFIVESNRNDPRYQKREAIRNERLALESQVAQRGTVPDAPFKTSWHELAMKRMIRYAVDNGYDAISWTKGETQFKRYGSSEIAWVKDVGRYSGKDGWKVKATEQRGGEADGINIEGAARAEGILKEGGSRITTKEQLRDVVENTLMDRERGQWSPENFEKQVDKLTDRVWERMQTEDAGTSLPRKEGMEGFYDKMLPKIKTWKKLGLKVEEGSFDTGDFKVMKKNFQGEAYYRLENRNDPDAISTHPTAEAAWAAAEKLGATAVHIVRLTPEVKAKVTTEGLERFMPAGREYAGKHEAPTSDGGSPGHDVARLTYPDDIYGPKAAQYYGHYGQNNPMDVSAIRVIHGMKGNPNKPIEIYRAVPKGLKEPKLSTGDWVTITRKYAKEHGEATLEGSYEIISQSVHAKDIWTDGNSIHEWGYDPQTAKQLRLERDLKKLKRN